MLVDHMLIVCVENWSQIYSTSTTFLQNYNDRLCIFRIVFFGQRLISQLSAYIYADQVCVYPTAAEAFAELLKLIFSTIELRDKVEKQLYAAFTLKIDKGR